MSITSHRHSIPCLHNLHNQTIPYHSHFSQSVQSSRSSMTSNLMRRTDRLRIGTGHASPRGTDNHLRGEQSTRTKEEKGGRKRKRKHSNRNEKRERIRGLPTISPRQPDRLGHARIPILILELGIGNWHVSCLSWFREPE